MILSYETLISGLAPVAAGTALANSTTLTDITPTVSRSVLPSNFLKAGSALRVTAWGSFSNTATPTLILGVYYGGVAGVALGATGATTTTTGATNWPWRVEYTGIVRSDGASGTILGNGIVMLGTSLTAMTNIWIPNVALANVTIDTTAAKEITIGAQWSAASASNTITCHGLLVESVA